LAEDQWFGGINAKYYKGSWDSLPYVSSLTPVSTDVVQNLNFEVTENEQFATSGMTHFMAAAFDGFIQIKEDGIWEFEISSDDGSDFWIADHDYPPNWTQVVDNNGLHGFRTRKGTMELEAGWYPFFISYFQKEGKHGLYVKRGGPNTPMGPPTEDELAHGSPTPPPNDFIPKPKPDEEECARPDWNLNFNKVVNQYSWREWYEALNDPVTEEIFVNDFSK
jgi:hypothetical protein